MSVERIIGIDFGTSTSVIRVKRYKENGQPVDDRLYTAEVKFESQSFAPTVIQRVSNERAYYGFDALKPWKYGKCFQNFRLELENSDQMIKKQAYALTEEFFVYMARQYRNQSLGGFLGKAGEMERTLVGCSLRWSEETRKFVLEAAQKAGFPNVGSMSEVQAIITDTIARREKFLLQQGYIRDNIPSNILMINMGTNGTDLVLGKYINSIQPQYDILSVWPKEESRFFGGRETEILLQEYLRGKLPEEDVDTVMKHCKLNSFKSWKEDFVSPALGRKEAVTEFYEFDERIEDLDIEIEEYAIDRDEFEKMAAAYLKEFPMLVNGCLEDAGLSGDEVDLVLLTGGHSQWYFVKELLLGRLNQFGTVGLGKIQVDPARIILSPQPRETVAMGLVCSPLIKPIQVIYNVQEMKGMEMSKEAAGSSIKTGNIGGNQGKNCRIIGIDFGTSTSVIRVKRYRDGEAMGERLDVKEVTFNSTGQSLVPTLIREMQAGEPYYGFDAQKEHKKSTLFDNFKVELESPDPQERERARALTEQFFTYLSKQYKDQSSGGFLGEADDTERTLVSYPVKWSGETRRFMLDAARKAGFKNVEGMDEAQAAITAVMVQSADYLSQRGYLHDGVPANILMADMGAGTTDLVLCRYTPGKSAAYEILSAWPRDGGALFGGREVEGMLRDYLRGMLPEEDADTVMKKCKLNMFKSWKEDYVSPALARGEAVTDCADMDTITDLLEIDVEEYALDRAAFEEMAAQYLKGFPELVNGCLKDAGLSGDEVDLVLLTGGHSQWYFVKEQLCGKLERFGAVGLGKIQADPKRIIPVPRPQETVALGLVYSPLAKEVRFAGEEAGQKIKPTGQTGGEDRMPRQAEVRVGAKLNAQPVHTESGVWDESMRVLPVTPEEEFVFQKMADGYQVTKYLGTKDMISVPAQYRGKPVTSIGRFCFGERRYAHRTIEIPGSVQTIGYGAFESNYLEKVILHEGLQTIMERAFLRAHISSINLPESLQMIDQYAFCKNDLRKVFISANCTFIGMMAFKDNPALDSVVFPQNTKISKLDEYAFLDTNIKNVKIPYYCKCNKLVRNRVNKTSFLGLLNNVEEELITIERY